MKKSQIYLFLYKSMTLFRFPVFRLKKHAKGFIYKCNSFFRNVFYQTLILFIIKPYIFLLFYIICSFISRILWFKIFNSLHLGVLNSVNFTNNIFILNWSLGGWLLSDKATETPQSSEIVETSNKDLGVMPVPEIVKKVAGVLVYEPNTEVSTAPVPPVLATASAPVTVIAQETFGIVTTPALEESYSISKDELNINPKFKKIAIVFMQNNNSYQETQKVLQEDKYLMKILVSIQAKKHEIESISLQENETFLEPESHEKVVNDVYEIIKNVRNRSALVYETIHYIQTIIPQQLFATNPEEIEDKNAPFQQYIQQYIATAPAPENVNIMENLFLTALVIYNNMSGMDVEIITSEVEDVYFRIFCNASGEQGDIFLKHLDLLEVEDLWKGLTTNENTKNERV